MEDQLSCVATKHEADHSMSACEPRDEREDGGGVGGGEGANIGRSCWLHAGLGFFSLCLQYLTNVDPRLCCVPALPLPGRETNAFQIL